MAGTEVEGVRRRGCTYQKNDFLPEESFQTSASYLNALKETPGRLANRVFSRSKDNKELAVRDCSSNQMKKTLSWWDLIWFGMGAVIGAGIFVLTGLEAQTDAGPAVVLSYVVSGGAFAYIRVELGDLVAFIAAGNIILNNVIAGAAVARSWTSYLATLIGKHPESLRFHVSHLSPDYTDLDPIAVGVCVLICLIAVFSTKGSSRLNYVASGINYRNN